MEKTHKVKVRGNEIDVNVSQVSRAVWIATGKCLGDIIETTDQSEMTALKRWREAAEYKSG